MLANDSMELVDGSKVGIIGGGPAGSLTGYFIQRMAQRIDLQLDVDIYEPADFSRAGPPGCNMCGGIVSESLVQMLAIEGINLPPDLVQCGIDSYMLHTDLDSVLIHTPLEEMRIAALFRGGGPKGSTAGDVQSFDAFLLNLACEQGARHLKYRVVKIAWQNNRPIVVDSEGGSRDYDLIVGAVGVNSQGLNFFERFGLLYRQPCTTRTAVMELKVGRQKVKELLGSSMHVFMLDIERFEFAALIPKGDYITVCVLGENVDGELLKSFISRPQVRSFLPQDFEIQQAACRCMPKINLGGAKNFFEDRVVIVGDFGVTRLYKDGIGAAYRTAKACAVTAIFHGVSKQDFTSHYWPTPRRIEFDNRIGKLMFSASALLRKSKVLGWSKWRGRNRIGRVTGVK